jgi:hypothetical protein
LNDFEHIVHGAAYLRHSRYVQSMLTLRSSYLKEA